MLLAPEGEVCDFPEDERPELRASTARLAGALKVWYARSSPGLPEPNGVALWRDSCKSDCLPEVRRAFGFWEQLAG